MVDNDTFQVNVGLAVFLQHGRGGRVWQRCHSTSLGTLQLH